MDFLKKKHKQAQELSLKRVEDTLSNLKSTILDENETNRISKKKFSTKECNKSDISHIISGVVCEFLN